MPLFNKFLLRSPVIELLANSLLENKEEVMIFSSKNEAIGLEKYLKRTIGLQKFISDTKNPGRF